MLLINKLMFHPVKGGYDKTLPGYENIGDEGEAIAAVLLRPENAKKVFLYCHGNAEDMTGAVELFFPIIHNGFAFASVDYPGYGLSDGSPNEKGCYRVVHRLYDWLVKEKGFAPEDIIVVGFSIGTGPALELATSQKVGGLILQAAYLSAPRIVTKVRILPIDPFPNLHRISKLTCPLLMLHGTSDSIIPYQHGARLFSLAPEPKQFISVEGADHNDFMFAMGYPMYCKMVMDFANSTGAK